MKERALRANRTSSILRSLGSVGIALASCGCGGGSESADTGTFATTPAAVMTTDGGSYRVAVQSAPDAVPSRGNNSLRLVVTRASNGAPATGLAIDVVPWMPAMGHGSSVTPSVALGDEPGSYTVRNIELFMPGLWEIRTTIGGATTDHVTARFDVR